MDAQKLYEMMKKIQESKGYYFNEDRERTFELLDALIQNKERYGYMGCPCRLLSGDRENDRELLLQPLCVQRLEREQDST